MYQQVVQDFNLALFRHELTDEERRQVMANLQQYERAMRSTKVMANRQRFDVGSVVKVAGLRPKWVNGMELTVDSIRNTRFTTTLRGKSYTVPIDCVTEVVTR